ncbi:MAG TPA: hypothetical protein DCL54_05040 [Alphaproteobacteria bacterium]|nr:hypothetical protein [Alphaproteobacteria bacterium]
MPRAVKSKWTPEAEKAAAKMWNDLVDTNRIVLRLKADHGVIVKAEDIHSLLRRKGGQLGMIEGHERQRADRPERVVNRKVKVRKPVKAEVAVVEGIDLMDLGQHQCRYPLTKTLPHKFCGAETVHGSWCAKHLDIIKGKKS